MPLIYRLGTFLSIQMSHEQQTSGKRRPLRHFSPSVEKYKQLSLEKYIEFKNEKEGYLCKQVLFDGKTHVISTLERQKIVVK